MPSRRRRKTRYKKHYHILFILLLIVAVTFFLYEESGKEDLQGKKDPKSEISRQVQPEEIAEHIPKVAIVIDDLGPSKKAALKVFDIKAPLTLSIFPHKTYTKWIAEQGHRLGYDVIGYIPMEASKPYRLDKGGLYTWMTDYEIRETLKEALDSIPHIKGVSNHMGSAFTKDERTMYAAISVLKEYGLFFLDSFTTPESAGIKIATEHKVKTLKRDIFLDYKDSPDYIEARWEELIKLARRKGYAIAIAHPRKITVEFLKNALPSNEVMVVPLSELLVSP